ncbi:MAG: FUSC family protein [Confluentimicrobium sp.]|jgi:hypothetical protein|uniref:FUSC family protein n=1 Tax=Actibacterium sp. TaxID=1872125 RepID=UPI00050EF52C|nr:FUSC family protein [Actibacterium sp.]KGB83788.1 hypothetical protein JT55_01235 [Rhodovulum sp. NI22]MBC57123.1 FUSC family protein [Actibacterium sp.]MDY6860565.1 FUSC family protein [Pseudomonadota bacterium]|tara:strand:+ start:1929 stop:2957 length:1029 start_codon:yes stop_codon:yes gene_type:complete
MYVTPRPVLADDPLFAVRMAFMSVIGIIVIQITHPAIPPLIAALPVGLMAGSRKAFSPARAIGAPIAFIAAIWLMTALVALTRDVPVLMLALVFCVYFLAFYITRRTGSPFGMLILVAASLMSIMGMKERAALFYFRDGFIEGSLVALVAVPVLYYLLPAASNQVHVDEPEPAWGHHGKGSLIRAVVMMLLSFWLHAILPASDMLLAVAAVFVLVFPTREQVFSEARERVIATAYGAGLSIVILTILTLSSHFEVLIGLVFLAGLFLADRMIHGRYEAMVYQFALTTTLALVMSALSTQSPGYAAFTRIVLVFGGAVAAAFLVALLDAIFLGPDQPDEPATQ